MEYGKLRNFDLNLLVVLGAILEHQSVSAAAEELCMSQSTASHALTRLRLLMGDELFVKTRNRMMPTPKALELAQPVSDILHAASDMLLSTSSFHPTQTERTLVLALGDVGEIMFLPTLLDYMRREAPNCTIQTISCQAHEAEVLLLDGKLDLYVGNVSSPSLDLMCQKLYEDDMVAICSKRYPHDGPLSMAEFAQADHVVNQIRSQAKNRINQLLEDNGYKRTAKVTTPNATATPFIVSNDPTLISAYPRSLANFIGNTYDIKVLELDFESGFIQVFQYWHRRYNNDPFISWIRKSMFEIFNAGTSRPAAASSR